MGLNVRRIILPFIMASDRALNSFVITLLVPVIPIG